MALDNELTIFIIAMVSLLLVGLILMQVYFYLHTFLNICCPPKMKNTRMAQPRESIPLTTNVTQLSSLQTEIDRI